MGDKPVSSVSTAEYEHLLFLLRDARLKSGFSQRTLSVKLGMSPTYIDKVERGIRRIDVVEFCEFAKAVGIDPRELFSAFADLAYPSQSERKSPEQV